MSENTGKSYAGPGFLSLLTLLFIGLKLTGHITWSWVWVLSPLWIGFLTIVIATGIAAGVLAVMDRK